MIRTPRSLLGAQLQSRYEMTSGRIRPLEEKHK